MQERKRKIHSGLLVLVLIISAFSHVFIFGPMVMIGSADPGDQGDSYYNATTLNVTVLQLEPRINWYDFQNSTADSLLNEQIDVNQEYYFYINISSDQGWDDIEFANISCWHDLGDDTSSYNYNNTLGSNINMKLQYENTTATGNVGTFRLLWNSTTVTLGSCSEANVTGSDPGHSPGNTETYNLTFAFTPGYQFRYAPDPIDDVPGFNDTWSWNFNITCDDASGYHSYDNPIVGETIDEFGVYRYTEIISAGWPTITGNPGDSPAYNDSYITIETRSNGNYSFSANVTNLTHKTQPSYFIQNTSILTAGGELSPLTLFSGTGPHYYYNNSGVGSLYTPAEKNYTSLSTTDIEWAVNIPMGQYPGDYNASIYYRLQTQA
ncbi:MAG: hypothetical protein JSW60_06185 [Thermoplasmatales archaeon]|nr:MAG: hypothetical protein JSW60_06185 [Thermoplasmatales archaeon]